MSAIKLMIDPGHGGRDPGAVANGLVEKDLVLTIAHHVRNIMVRDYGVHVRMTRNSDVFVSLEERARIANEWGADYFLSIHCNAGGGTGFETFRHPSAKSQTSAFQDAIHHGVTRRLSVANRGMKTANFAVLRMTNMPAVLTENLFVDHPGDARQLKDSDVLYELALGHVEGLVKLLNLKPVEVKVEKAPPSSMYRLRVDGQQVGAFSERYNLLEQLITYLGNAEKIELEKV
ncbi:N-acetylmuramoyl-L-alanine amidase [Bacillus sp. FJAT-45037]|uniref:N-acetylmuramoyl-L-alanine amidase n=1 Tax=Bacillus sp. FJAT-45037 TaxID=2011007 RepID=UPI000C24A4B2|nr:N-acetylmuramoyl-L-alanine amidase [Bacillus sp. FJAT-45037]